MAACRPIVKKPEHFAKECEPYELIFLFVQSSSIVILLFDYQRFFVLFCMWVDFFRFIVGWLHGKQGVKSIPQQHHLRTWETLFYQTPNVRDWFTLPMGGDPVNIGQAAVRSTERRK